MKSIWNSLAAGGCHVFGLALLVLSAMAGGSAVRAADPPILQSIVFDPIAQIVLRVEQRVADLQAAFSTFAESFTSERIVAQQLCVADDSGAQTCISKTQLDALLRSPVQISQAPVLDRELALRNESDTSHVVATATPPLMDEPAAAEDKSTVSMPEVAVPVAAAMPSVTDEPIALVGDSAASMPQIAVPTATEQPIAAGGETGTPPPATAAAGPMETGQPAVDRPAAAFAESIVPTPVPPTVQPSSEHLAATTGESGTLIPAVAAAVPPAEPAETIVVVNTAATVAAPEQQEKTGETATADPMMADSPVPDAEPVQGSPALDRLQ
ncbi:MAG TPA: hypothetical protein VKP67_07925 [Xanthobacteraceae bacterium]|nr:hypothetical protein [Xanthobacteraceae bacterium]